jgi:hypothetical protein
VEWGNYVRRVKLRNGKGILEKGRKDEDAKGMKERKKYGER